MIKTELSCYLRKIAMLGILAFAYLSSGCDPVDASSLSQAPVPSYTQLGLTTYGGNEFGPKGPIAFPDGEIQISRPVHINQPYGFTGEKYPRNECKKLDPNDPNKNLRLDLCQTVEQIKSTVPGLSKQTKNRLDELIQTSYFIDYSMITQACEAYERFSTAACYFSRTAQDSQLTNVSFFPNYFDFNDPTLIIHELVGHGLADTDEEIRQMIADTCLIWDQNDINVYLPDTATADKSIWADTSYLNELLASYAEVMVATRLGGLTDPYQARYFNHSTNDPMTLLAQQHFYEVSFKILKAGKDGIFFNALSEGRISDALALVDGFIFDDGQQDPRRGLYFLIEQTRYLFYENSSQYDPFTLTENGRPAQICQK